MNRNAARILIAAILLASGYVEARNLILQYAGNQRGTYRNGEMIVTLRHDVTFLYDDVTIKSDLAQWWKSRGDAKFSSNVRVHRDKQVLTCHRAEYIRKENNVHAHSDVVFVDEIEGVRISGEHCTYNLDTKECRLTGNPQVLRFDTTDVDTLTIVGRTMTYDDSLKLTTAHEGVVITKGSLRSICEDAYYFTETGKTKLRNDPEITYDSHVLNGDSVNLLFVNDTLDNAEVVGNAHGFYIDHGAADTTHTRVWGDSLYMSWEDGGALDSVWVHGHVRSAYNKAADSLSPNKVAGKTMVLNFGERSRINDAMIEGNATSIYHMEGESGDAARNEASGDTLSVWFKEGRAVRLRLKGGVRGTYYPQ